MKLPAINVVETLAGQDPSIHTFADTAEGFLAAEALFRKVAADQEGYFAPDEIDAGWVAGWLRNEDSTWKLDFIRSED